MQDLDTKCVNTIRCLPAADVVQKANRGHPGAPTVHITITTPTFSPNVYMSKIPLHMCCEQSIFIYIHRTDMNPIIMV